MLKLTKFSVFSLLFSLSSGIQSQSNYLIFLEANRLASSGDIENAFNLLKVELETNNRCKALGYYWMWSIQYGDMVNDSVVTFRSKSTGLSVKPDFSYTFSSKQKLIQLIEQCKSTGILHHAAGMYYWKQTQKLSLNEGQEAAASKSLNHYRLAMRYGSIDSLSTFGLGQALEYHALFAEALRYYHKSHEFNNNQNRTLLKISACHGKLSHWDSCRIYAQKVVLRAESDEELGVAYRLIAESYWQGKQQKKKSKKFYKLSLSKDYSSYDNRISYIEFLHTIRKHKKACNAAVRLLVEQPYHNHIHVGLTYIFQKRELDEIYDKALKELGGKSAQGKHILTSKVNS